MNIQIVNDSINPLPKYATPGSSGVDVMADFTKGVSNFLFNSFFEDNKLTILPLGRALVPTNIKTNIPEGYEIQIRSRSGLALKQGIFCTNGIGTIDSDFRNYYGIILTNSGTEPFVINQGDRIAQAVLIKVEKIDWELVDELNDTDRGLGGFGSTNYSKDGKYIK